MTNPNDSIHGYKEDFLYPKDMPEEWVEKCRIVWWSRVGLTKRELFSAMAMTRLAEEHENRNSHWEADLAYNAVRVADALIAELNKEVIRKEP